MSSNEKKEKVTPEAQVSDREKELEGLGYIKTNVLWSMGVGLIPIPLVDILGVTAFQLRLLNQLGKLYDLEFKSNWGKSTIGSLLGGVGVGGLSRVGGSLTKFIPFVGPMIGVVVTPLSAGASTYAVGKIFLQHFASGGTFLTFDPEKVRGHFAELYEEGKLVASKMKAEATNKKAA
ncbi:DUF697 domain-containing protein [Deltaproteobacteria bacterium TL4]